ncbi:MAG TPA: hypothetical protein VH143_19320 [Kofleriaceae bacterium]|jgi:hypothetical protein|nr:hypothetical protein [Kofleriaceae bacterium]
MKPIDHEELTAVSGAGQFDCVAKFFPDGSLAGPWVHPTTNVWSWNRQECEEKAIARSVRR